MSFRHDLFRMRPGDFTSVSLKPQEDVCLCRVSCPGETAEDIVKAFQVCVPGCCSADVLLSSAELLHCQFSWSLGSILSTQDLYLVVFYGDGTSQQSSCDMLRLVALPSSSTRCPRLLNLKTLGEPLFNTCFFRAMVANRYFLEKK